MSPAANPQCHAGRNCGVWTPPVISASTEVLLIEALPRAGVRPLLVPRRMVTSVSEVGLFRNAALSGPPSKAKYWHEFNSGTSIVRES